jgi:hypothetical protein
MTGVPIEPRLIGSIGENPPLVNADPLNLSLANDDIDS